MAGFQVANFDFGQNIEKNAIERQRIAASSALQARGQDIQAAESDARLAEQAAAREEGARQFDAQQAERAENREEDARQFDDRMAFAERNRLDERSDKARSDSWDDALKRQQMEIEDAKLQKWSAEVDELLARGQRDREEYEQKIQAQQDLRESALGMVSEGVLLSGPMGGFTPSQVRLFNEKFGQQFDCIGRRDSLTGEEYDDGLIHLVQYQKDKDGNIMFGYQDANGNVIEDPRRQNRNSKPLLLQDQTISKEDYQIGLGRLREYGGSVMKGGSGSGLTYDERMSLEKEKGKRQDKAIEDRQTRSSKERDLQKVRIGKSIAENMREISRNLKLDDKQSSALQKGLQNIILSIVDEESKGSGSEGDVEQKSDKGTIKTDDNGGDVEFKQLSREEFAELAKTDPEKARAYLAELKKRKSSK